MSEQIKLVAMAVYHYAASVRKQFDGPAHHDGVITCPVITGGDDYIAAREQIARQVGAGRAYLVEVKSLSFVGEVSNGVGSGFIGPAGETEEVITWPQRKLVITATHETVGDDRFTPMALLAIRECARQLDEEIDFTASNGVRVRTSWPRPDISGV